MVNRKNHRANHNYCPIRQLGQLQQLTTAQTENQFFQDRHEQRRNQKS